MMVFTNGKTVKEYEKENCSLSTLPDFQEREYVTALFYITG
jgi:hypothetical protein